MSRSPHPITLRPLEPTDAPALHALLTHPDVAVDLAEHDPSQPVSVFRGQLETITPSAGAWIGAERDGALIGAAHLWVWPNPRRRHTGRITLGVSPSARRQGVGRALLAAAADAGSRGYRLDRLELSLPAEAEAGLSLARSHGFVEEARRRRSLFRQGAYADVVLMTWLRPGVTAQSSTPSLPERPGDRLAVTLRTAVPTDAPAIAEMQGTESVRGGTMQLPFTPARLWRERLETNDPALHHIRVAEHQGRVVGLAGLHGEGLLRSRHAWSFGMSVHPDAQGRGVGQALVLDVLALADGFLGATRVELEVYSDNERAVRLYRAHGFEAEGLKRADTWRGDGYVDTVVMARLRSP